MARSWSDSHNATWGPTIKTFSLKKTPQLTNMHVHKQCTLARDIAHVLLTWTLRESLGEPPISAAASAISLRDEAEELREPERGTNS